MCELASPLMLSGRFQEAEDEFVKAGKPREAIDMWCHQQDWAAALSVAERCDPQSVPDILAAQVGLAANAGPEQKPASAASLTVACAFFILHPVAAFFHCLSFVRLAGGLSKTLCLLTFADCHTNGIAECIMHQTSSLLIVGLASQSAAFHKGLPQMLSHALWCAPCSNRHASLDVSVPVHLKRLSSGLNSPLHIVQGNLAATQQDWATAEALFVRAKQPEAALAMYRAARRWEDALRVAEAHLPAKVGCLLHFAGQV